MTCEPNSRARLGAVIVVKDLPEAKSRLAELPVALRERLVVAMLADTVAVAQQVADEVVLVSSVWGLGGALPGVRVIPDPQAGLNGAFAAGERVLREAGCERIVAVMADLPALTVADLQAATSAPTGRHHVVDHQGTGTTVLYAATGALDPAFGPDSAQRHASGGSAPLEVADGARVDVDTVSDLARAAELGLGTRTQRLWRDGALAQADHGVVVAATADGWLLVGADGVRRSAPRATIDQGLRTLHPGQRVHLARVGETITDLWL